ncbi:hypothetical protein [Actinokineospora sp.]|uniref:hypothetical protein n=1 Tax=Actinokineospora sp. TaxID=1872133 RepID=UPI003D6C62F0
MSGLQEITQVILSMPGPRASTEEVAAWYERKARLLEQIAAEGGPDSDQVSALALLAHRRSQALLDRAA